MLGNAQKNEIEIDDRLIDYFVRIFESWKLATLVLL